MSSKPSDERNKEVSINSWNINNFSLLHIRLAVSTLTKENFAEKKGEIARYVLIGV
jgi:hypothetical protein